MNLKKKNMIMLGVGALLIVMAVGYAAAYTTLRITGTASMEASWDIAITGIDEGTPVGSAYNKSTPTYTGTTATFDVGFKSPGDKIVYELTITNNGTIDAYLYNISYGSYYNNLTNKLVESGIDNLSIYTIGLRPGEVLEKGQSKTLQIVVRVDNSEIINNEIYENEISINLFFAQEGRNYSNYGYSPNSVVVLSDNKNYRVLKDNGETLTVITEDPIDDLSIYDSTYSVDGVKNYLNTTYKLSLSSDILDNIVGDIEIPNYMDYDNQDVSDNDTKYIGGFLKNVVTTCYKYGGTSGKGSNCDLGWLAEKNPNYDRSLMIFRDETKNINIQLDDTYMIMEGTRLINDAIIYDENGNVTSQKMNFEFNAQNPLIGSLFNMYDASGTVSVENGPHDNIIVYDGKVYTGFVQGSISIYNPEHLYLYPVMTIKKSAIK